MPPLGTLLPLMAVLAVCAALASRRAWRASAGWVALLVAGQAALLALYRSGPGVGYDHLRPDLGTTHHQLALGVLLLQAALTGAALLKRRAAVAAWLRAHVGTARSLLVLAVLALASAKIARPAQAFALELVAVACAHLVALCTLALAAMSLSPDAAQALERRFQGLLGAPGNGAEPGGPDRFAWSLAVGAALVCSLLAVSVYQRHPHVPDEVVYLLHARYLAAGRLGLEAPPVPQGFDVDLMLLSGARWYCPVPIGWPLALSVGAFLGVPWLVNPLLTAALVLATYCLARELADRRTARLVALLLAVSPWLWFLGMSFMTHTWQLVCTSLAALGVARARRTGSLAWAAGAGAAIGMVALIRPLDGLVLALLLGLWSIGVGGRALRPAATALLVLGAVLVGGATLPYNARMTGDPFLFPIMAYNDVTYAPGSNDLGFGPEKGAGMDWRGLDPWPGHTPAQALVNHQFNLFSLDQETFGWATGSLWLALLALVVRTRSRADRPMAAAVGATILASSFYYFAGGPDFGARYWATALVPICWLSASGLRFLEERAGAGRTLWIVAVLGVAALATFVPWRASVKYPGYRGMRPGAATLAHEHGFGRSLVLVRGRRHPDYASAAADNPLAWDPEGPLFAWDRDPAVRLELLARYGDRPVYILAGPSLTGAGFRLEEGPLRAAELAERTRSEADREPPQ